MIKGGSKIFIVTHKKINDIYMPGYDVLLLGAEKNDTFDNDYWKDNIGNNISSLNNAYCELTGLYWIWKNTSYQVVGLVHYRRFFVNITYKFKIMGRFITSPEKSYELLSMDEAQKILQNTDIIVKKSEWRRRNNKTLLTEQIGDECVTRMTKTIFSLSENYRNELIKIYEEHSHINCNMFIGKKQVIDDYCVWLFPVLERINMSHFNATGEYYHNREIGYMAEILFGLWIRCNNIKYVFHDVVFTGDDMSVNSVVSYDEIIPFFITKMNSRIKKKYEKN